MYRVLKVLSLLFFVYQVQAQQISGLVLEEGGSPLVGANIVIQGTEIGVSADLEGKFSLEVEKFPIVLHIQFIGFEDILLEVIEPSLDLNIEMKPSNNLITCGPWVIDTRPSLPIALETLDAQDLKIGNEVDYQQILNTIPGVYMHSGALNTNRITIRGIGSRSLFSTSKIRAYFEDIPLTSGIGETAIEDIDPSILSSLDLYKGPASSLYGSGLGGTFILKGKMADDFKTTIHSRISAGAFGLINLGQSFSHASRGVNILGSFNLTHSDGYRENNEYNRQSGFVFAQFETSDKNELSILLNQIHLKAFIPSSLDSVDFADNPQQAAFTWNRTQGNEDTDITLAGISFNHRFNQSLEQKTSVFMNRRNSFEVRPFNLLDDQSTSLGFRSVWKWRLFTPSNLDIQISAGTEYFREQYDWQTYENADDLGTQGILLSDNEEIRQQANVFTQAELFFDNTTRLVFGLNLNDTRYDLEDQFNLDSLNVSGDYRFNPIVSPRLAINFPIVNDLRGFGLVSHGFSPPTVEETLNPDGTVNPEIQPEKGWNFEAGFRWNNRFDRMQGTVSAYYMLVQDLLVARRTGLDQFVGVNAGSTTHIGLEFQFRYNIIESDDFIQKLVLDQNYHFAHFRFTDFVDGENDFSGNTLTGSPPHVYNADLSLITKPGIYLGSQFRVVSDIPVNDANTVYSDAYALLNTKVGFRRTLGPVELDLFVGLNNVLDSQYASMLQINAQGFGGNLPRYFYPGLPRHVFGGISAKWLFKAGF